jgi:23S rRNA (pseudouridine1915-N3)-methyltransferase
MRLLVVAVGKLRSAPMRALADDYEQRLRRYLKVEVIEVREARKVEAHNTEPAVREEGLAILAALPPGATLVAMDERGQMPTSVEFSQQIQQHMTYEPSDLAFAIGGALGLHREVLEASRRSLALSRMTLPHELARVTLLEQLYRAMTLLRGEPYHK